MRGINQIFLLGRIGHDPDLKQTANEHCYLNLSVATNRSIRRDDKWEDITDWHQVRTWNQTAELCTRVLTKGSPIAVEGHLRTDQWVDQNGDKHSRTYVHADRIHFLPHSRPAVAK